MPGKGNARNQYLGVFRHLLVAIGFGAACGWSSPSIPILQSGSSPLSTGPITDNEASWVASMISIGSFSGIILYGWAIDVFGRRITGIFLGVPQVLSWILIAFPQNPYYLYMARFLAGLAGGMFILVPIYVTEIAETRIRGFLGSLMIFAANFGVLLAFVIGAYLEYTLAALVFIPLAVIAVISSVYFPETPIYLARRNRIRDAEKSLSFYRGLTGKGATESLLDELEQLKTISIETKKQEGSDKLALSDFTSRPVKKAILVGIVLAMLNQLTGVVAMIQYTATIFEKTGSAMSPNASTIIVGISQLLGTYVSTLLVERAGRKVLVASSAFGVSLGLLGLASCCYLAAQGFDVSRYSWIPFLSFCFMTFTANVGILSLPFLILAEILPDKIKTVTSSCTMLLLNLFMFFTIKFFPFMMTMLTIYGTMLTFAIISTAGAVFVILFQPETKGRTSAEIMKILEK